MTKKQHAVTLTVAERQEQERLVTRGKKSTLHITRGRILLLIQDGWRVTEITQN
ncbi:MAG: hypothetical protein AB1671_20830 [Thermodesulfobacteriota bacterium]|jgi:hypothetical protein